MTAKDAAGIAENVISSLEKAEEVVSLTLHTETKFPMLNSVNWSIGYRAGHGYRYLNLHDILSLCTYSDAYKEALAAKLIENGFKISGGPSQALWSVSW